MNEKKKNSLKKPLTISVFLIFLFVLLCGKGYPVQTPDNSNHSYSFAEKTISSILSILGGNHFTVLLKNTSDDQGDATNDDEQKKNPKKSEEDPQETNGSRTSKKKPNSED